MSVQQLGQSKSGNPSTGDDNHSDMMVVDREPKHAGKSIRKQRKPSKARKQVPAVAEKGKLAGGTGLEEGLHVVLGSRVAPEEARRVVDQTTIFLFFLAVLRDDVQQFLHEKPLVDVSQSGYDHLRRFLNKHVATGVSQSDYDRVLAEKLDLQEKVVALSTELGQCRSETRAKEELADLKDRSRSDYDRMLAEKLALEAKETALSAEVNLWKQERADVSEKGPSSNEQILADKLARDVKEAELFAEVSVWRQEAKMKEQNLAEMTEKSSAAQKQVYLKDAEIEKLSAEIIVLRQEAKTKEQDLADMREKSINSQEQVCLKDIEVNRGKQEAEHTEDVTDSSQGQLCRQAVQFALVAQLQVAEEDRKWAEVDPKKLRATSIECLSRMSLNVEESKTGRILNNEGDHKELSKCQLASQRRSESHITIMMQVACMREQRLGSMKGKSLTAHEQASLEELEITQVGEQAGLKYLIETIESSCRQRGAELKEAEAIVKESQRSPDTRLSGPMREKVEALVNTLRTSQEDREANLKACKLVDHYFTQQRILVKELLGKGPVKEQLRRGPPQAAVRGRPRSKRAGAR